MLHALEKIPVLRRCQGEFVVLQTIPEALGDRPIAVKHIRIRSLGVVKLSLSDLLTRSKTVSFTLQAKRLYLTDSNKGIQCWPGNSLNMICMESEFRISLQDKTHLMASGFKLTGQSFRDSAVYSKHVPEKSPWRAKVCAKLKQILASISIPQSANWPRAYLQHIEDNPAYIRPRDKDDFCNVDEVEDDDDEEDQIFRIE